MLERIGGLVGDRLDELEIGFREGLALLLIGHGQDAELLLAIMERHGDVGLGLEVLLPKPREAVVELGALGENALAGAARPRR